MAISYSNRFLDVGEEPMKILPPITGYEKVNLVPLAEAVAPLKSFVPNVRAMSWVAMENACESVDTLSSDESAAICLYTMAEEPANIYTPLNLTLRSGQRTALRPWFLYLKLLLTALYKLPSIQGTVWRGIRGDVSGQYKKDEYQTWWGFSSCTETISVVEGFIGTTGKRTLFNIQCLKGKNIRTHSRFQMENEILLLPGTYFKVVDKLFMPDFCIVHLQEVIPPYQLISDPFPQTGSIISNDSPKNVKEQENEKKFTQRLIDSKNIPADVNIEEYRKYILQDYYNGCDENIARIFMQRIRDQAYIPRLLIVGMTGVGKSSLVNLLASKKVAEVSDSATGCTLDFAVHKIVHNSIPFEVVDTVGLNEHSRNGGQARRVEALKKLVQFVKKNNRGFSCIIFVVSKGRIYDAFERDYFIFYKCLLKSSVRTILFVNRCEDDEPMQKWYQSNERLIRKDYAFDRVVCGTTLRGGPIENFLVEKREETESALWTSIMTCLNQNAPLPIEGDISFIKSVWNIITVKLGWSTMEKSETLDEQALQQALHDC